jgi:hypothetical protein
LLERTIGAHETEIERLNVAIAASFDAEELARVEALRLAPTQRSDAKGAASAPARIVRKRDEQIARRDGLLREISAGRRLLEELAREADVEIAAEQASEARALVDVERDAVKVLSDAFVAFHAAFGVLVDAAEARDRFRLDVKAEHRELVENGEWLAAVEQPLAPFPVDVLEAFLMCWRSACDPHGEGTREDGLRVDHSRLLVGLTPSLRARYASLSGGRRSVRRRRRRGGWRSW